MSAKSEELYSIKNGKQHDASLHDSILKSGKTNRDVAVSRAVDLGLTQEEIDLLYPVSDA